MSQPYMRPRRGIHLGNLFVVLLLGGCGGEAEETAANGPPGGGRPPAPVYVAQVQQGEVVPQTQVVGTVVAKRTSQVASGAEGKVNQFLVQEGQLVEEGQPLSILNMVTTNLGIQEAEKLLEVRRQEYEELKNGSREEEILKARAERDAARAALESAQNKLLRQRQLAMNNAVNQDDLDDAIERAATTKELLAAAEAALRLVEEGPRKEQVSQARAAWEAQQEHVEFLKAEREKRTTRAPFRGIIVEEHTEQGEWLSKGDPVVTIADLLDEVYVIANVDQLEVDNVRPGAEVDVEIQAPGKSRWTGRVESLIPKSEWQSGSRMFPVKVVIPNELFDVDGKQTPRLAEGMYARVTFRGEPRTALLVHKNAVIRSEIGSRVVAVLPGESPQTGTAKLVPIEEGTAFGDSIEVVSGDLTPGMTIVIEGAERLSPFQSVQISDPPAAPESAHLSQQP